MPLGREEGNIDGEEERRLCYVGMTRAKTRLILTRAQVRSRRGASRRSVPSRFLEEIPEELTEEGGAAAPQAEEEKQQMAQNFFAGIRDLLNK
jgi:superfamily I DNA/RNA helicase